MHDTPASARFGSKCAYTITTVTERLFNKNVGAASQGVQSLFNMKDRGRANENDIWFKNAKRIVQVRKALNA
jgi:hypothetical protein